MMVTRALSPGFFESGIDQVVNMSAGWRCSWKERP